MEKLQKHIGEHLKPVKLYYDDIEKILDIFSEVGNEIYIEADEYKINDPEEILTLKCPYFTNLEIRVYDPYISVSFGNSSIWLYASGDTPIQRGIFEKIKSFLKKKYRILAPVIQSSICSGVFTGASGWFFLYTKEYWSLLVALLMFLTGICWIVLGDRSKFKYFSLIIPSRRNSRPNFWKRNKDQLLLVVISALLGIIGTIFVTNFFSAKLF